jgi:hypothetical protein
MNHRIPNESSVTTPTEARVYLEAVLDELRRQDDQAGQARSRAANLEDLHRLFGDPSEELVINTAPESLHLIRQAIDHARHRTDPMDADIDEGNRS